MAIPETLYHYTPYMGTLCSILESGFWPKYSKENIEWLEFHGNKEIGLPGDKELGLPMVCFCDIPFQQIESHIRIFGYYGFGMSRIWAERNEISPVHYIRHYGVVANLYQDLKVNAKEELKRLTAYTQNYDYISESEWRYVPNIQGVPGYVIDRTLYDNQRMEYFNQITRDKAMLKFAPVDVKYIIVKFNRDVAPLCHWIQRRFTPNVAQLLMPKIITCENYFIVSNTHVT